MSPFHAVLDGLTRVPGVRGALLVSAGDGLVVAESTREGVDGAAVAALVSSLLARLDRTVRAAGFRALRSMHLESRSGGVMAMPAEEDLLLVAVADADANVGLLRLALRQAIERLH
jgi:predicted regulator of Ras-like GTPase activity (Roadblock/LC7/MglB family)